MSDKKIGLELREVPRNNETEPIFKVARRDGDASFLSLDEAFDFALVETLYFHGCYFPGEDPHETRLYMNCWNEKDAYVRNNGFEVALTRFDPKGFLRNETMNRAIAFTENARFVIEKYRSYKSRYFDERLK